MEKQEKKQNKQKLKLDPDVKLMFLTFKILILISCLMLIGSVISGMVVFVSGASTDDHVYNFVNDSFYSFNGSDFDETFNFRTNPTGNLEVDKWEFALESPDVLNSVGLDDPNGWTDVEQVADSVNINSDSTNDRIIYMYHGSEYYGLEKTDFDSIPYIFHPYTHYTDNLNVSFTYQYFSPTAGLNGNYDMEIYSNDSTLIVRVRMFVANAPLDRKLQYYDGAVYQDLIDNDYIVSGYTWNTFNIFVNYTDDVATLRFYNGTITQTFQFPLIAIDKTALDRVRFYCTNNAGYFGGGIKLDSIGVYKNGYSISDEYAWKSVKLPTNWNMRNNNLFKTIFNGYGMLNYTDGVYEVGSTTLENMLEGSFYTNITEILNVYTYYVGLLSDPYLIAYQSNYIFEFVWLETRFFNINELDVNGVKIIDTYTTVWLEYSYSTGYTDPTSNYFYVDDTPNSTDYRLYYTLTCQNSNLEYIQADFDVDTISSTNRTLNFRASIVGSPFMYCEGALYLNFLGGTSYGLTFDATTLFNQIIPQKLGILTFTILISDNDNDWASGNTVSGYVSEVTLIFFPNIGISITTISILSMLAPLIIMIAPTLAFAKKFGNKAIVPVLMMMSIVCVASNLIPFWMFFVLMLCFFALLIYDYKRKGVR